MEMTSFKCGKVYRAVPHDFGEEKKLPIKFKVKSRKEILRFWPDDSIQIQKIKEGGWFTANNLTFPKQKVGLIHQQNLDVSSETNVPNFRNERLASGSDIYEPIEDVNIPMKAEEWFDKPILPDVLLRAFKENNGDKASDIVSYTEDDLLKPLECNTQDGKVKVSNIRSGDTGYVFVCDVSPFCSKRWYRGRMSKLYVELMFQNVTYGTFLVWKVNNTQYIITVMLAQGQLKHFVVLQMDDWLFLEKSGSYDSFFSIVQECNSNEMPMHNPLKVPNALCGCPFENIEMPTQREADIVYVSTHDTRHYCELTIVKRLDNSSFGLVKTMKNKECFGVSWYAGDLSLQESQQLLNGKESGSFLVLNCEKPIGQYIVTISTNRSMLTLRCMTNKVHSVSYHYEPIN
ncbi:uncharacterized protein LOC130649135 isoform X1 [Hydractinia symbiolongicarpus]|uniref:uncharacterized protein LOC130649135 isoform X1 n=2 Tax=Hydractinia symbiolongicarpus TaxID=13093 RepID=UPI002550F6B1|nr:uncharacterized protein LOC130649135 isoform X1 [Hydractinia symbiolongicarpus]